MPLALTRVTWPAAATATDADLLAAFAGGRDEPAFAELVRRHGRLVRGTARRVVGDPAGADDVAQAAFLLLARKAAAGGWGPTVGPWLYRVTYRLAGKARAARRRAPRAPVPDAPGPAADPAAGLAWAEVRAALDDGLNRLPAGLRAPLVLCYLEGLTRDEAAARLGCSPGTLKGRLERGRDRLRRDLAGRGLSLPAALAGALVGEPAVDARAAAATARLAADYLATGAAPAAVRALLGGAAGWKATVGLAVVLAACAAGAGGLTGPAPQVPAGPPATPPVAAAPQPAPADPLPPGAIAQMGSTRFQHGSNIHDVAVSADGKWIVSYGSHTGYRVWDAATGREQPVAGMPAGATPDAFRRAGRAPGQGQWDAFVAPAGGRVVAVVPDRARPVTRFLDAVTGEQVGAVPADLRRLLARPANAEPLAVLSPTGRQFVWTQTTTEADSKVRRELMTADPAAPGAAPAPLLSFGDRPPFEARFSADGSALLLHFPDAYEVRDPATGAVRLTVPIGPRNTWLSPALLSPDGTTLAVVEPMAATFRLWDVATGKERPAVADQFEAVMRVSAFSPDGRSLFGVRQAGPSRLWDLAAGNKVRDFRGFGYGGGAAAFTPDGKRLVLADGDNVAVLDVATGKPAHAFGGHTGSVWRAAFLPGGRLVSSSVGDRTARVWDPLTGRESGTLTGPGGGLIDSAVSPDGRLIATAGYDRAVAVWDAATLGQVRRVRTPDVKWNYLAFSPDGRRLAAAGFGPTLRVIDPATGEVVREMVAAGPKAGGAGDDKGPGAYVLGVAFTPDGRHVLLRRNDEATVHVWDWEAGKEVRTVATGVRGLNQAVPSPDGRLLAVCGWDGLARLLDFESGKELRALSANPPTPPGGLGRHDTNTVYGIGFSPDGRLLAAGCGDGTVRVWEAATGGERAQFAGHRGSALCVAFSPDGRRLVSGGGDKALLTWDLAGADPGLAVADPADAWGKLADPDAKVGLAAVRRLAAGDGVRLLADRLRPAPAVDPAGVRALVGRLGGPRFGDREQATAGLAAVADAAEAELRELLPTIESAEARRRAAGLLDRLDPTRLAGDRLRTARAVEALERAGTADARAVLAKLAGGAPGARLTRDAAGAARRLAGRP